MKEQDPSLNQQFNEQYAAAVETIKTRAIWRIGEQITELEDFRCRCLTCRHESPHQRIDVARHRLLFGRSIRQIERARPMIRCRRCGTQRHTRDIDEFVVPTTIRLRAFVDAVTPTPDRRDATPPVAMVDALRAFGEEASEPLRRDVLQRLAADTGPDGAPFIEAVGRELALPKPVIARVVDTLG